MLLARKIGSFIVLLFALITVQYSVAFSTLLYGLVGGGVDASAFKDFRLFVVLSLLNIVLALFCVLGENPMKKWALAGTVLQVLTPVVVFAGFYIGN